MTKSYRPTPCRAAKIGEFQHLDNPEEVKFGVITAKHPPQKRRMRLEFPVFGWCAKS
jgi:hypothetical protein